MKYFLLLSLFVTPVNTLFAQSRNHPPAAGPYSVGYRAIFLTDSGRRYRPGALPTENLYYRPIELDLWYPAADEPHRNSAANQPPENHIAFGEFVSLLEQRSNRFQKDTVYNGLTGEIAQYLATNLQNLVSNSPNIPSNSPIHDTATLMRAPTNTFRNAQPAPRQFPLILYMCSFNGISYENINLFEWLAGHGYVVASITSVGRYPGNMTTQPADLLQQVDDGIFSMNYLKERALIDSTRIGVAGYSWGGLAALTLAMRSPAIKAILSLDGSEMHYYGESKDEDDNFNDLRRAELNNTSRITIPYMYLESGHKQTDREVDSIFNILPALRSQKNYIPEGPEYARFPSTTHEDFSGLLSLGKITLFDQLSLDYFDQFFRTSDSLGHRLDDLFRRGLADSIYAHPKKHNNSGLSIRGKVLDRTTKAPLAFVNVGVPEQNIGTVTGHNGNFVLRIDSSLVNDSLRISMVGYAAKTVQIRQLLQQESAIAIGLDQKIAELKEAVVSSTLPRRKIEGNRTTSHFISIGFPLRFLGAELGIRLNLGKHPVRLKNFHFTIASSRIDSAIFRLNIYNFKDGVPHLNLLSSNILIPVGKRTGAYTVDLGAYNLIAKEDVLLSLELVETSPSASGAVYFSAGFLNSGAWHRQTSQGRWKKAGGLGVGFNIEVARTN